MTIEAGRENMFSNWVRITKVLWITTCVGVPLYYWLLEDPTKNGELDLVAEFVLIVLTFPLGFVGLLVLQMLAIIVDLQTENAVITNAGNLFVLSTMGILGYAQWFILLPLILRKFWGLERKN